MNTRITRYIPRITLVVLFAIVQAAVAQVATISPAPQLQFFDSSGRPLSGGCLQTFQAGTTTPLATYSDAGGTANPNPVVLDASGRASVWLAARAYKFVLRAKTTGCAGGGGAVLYTTDNILDQGANLAAAMKAGTLAIGLTSSAATGSGGGVGVGNALLSATPGGLYVSLNGGAPVQLNGGGSGGGGTGTPGGPVTSVQFNAGGTPNALGGSSNFLWDNTGGILTIAAVGPNSSVVAPTLNCSKASGTTNCIQQKDGNFVIHSNGKAYFPAICTSSTDVPGEQCTYGLNAAGVLTVASCTGCGGSGSPGAPNTSVQFNNSGVFTGSANFLWDNANGIMTIGPVGPNSSIIAPTLNCSKATGTTNCVQQKDGLFQIHANGKAYFAGICTSSSDVPNEQCNYGLSAAGVLTVASCTGCGGGSGGGTAAGPATSVQFNSGGTTLAGSSNLTWDNGNAILTVGLIGAQSSLRAPVVNCTAATDIIRSCLQSASGQFQINSDGKGFFNLLCVNGNPLSEACTYGFTPTGVITVSSCVGCGGVTSLASGGNGLTFNNPTGAITATLAQDIRTTAAVQFGSVALSGGITTGGGFYGLSASGALTVSSCGGCGGLVPGGSSTQVQFNNGTTTTLGGSPNLVWDNGNSILTIGFINGQSSVKAPVLNCTASTAAGTPCVQSAGGQFIINADGKAFFNGLCTNGVPGSEACTYGLTAGGVLTVANCTGCGAGASGGSGVMQFSNGSGGFNSSPNLYWDGQNLIVGAAATSMISPVFSCSKADTTNCVTQASGQFQIHGNGKAYFAGICTQSSNVPAEQCTYGMTNTGALTVSSCTGCGGGVTSVSSSGNGLTASPTAGAVVLTLAQNLSTSGSPQFVAITSSSTVTASGSVSGSGLTATSAGATITKSGSNYAIAEFDSGGNCNIGTVYAGGIGCSSDARLKKNVKPITDALADVMRLNPVTFTWIKNNEPGVGFIAQEVAKIFPQLVQKGPDDYLILSETGIVPELVRAIQQLTARVAALEARR